MIVPSAQIQAAYSKLPLVIREYLSGEELGTVTEAIGATYGLHVDTIGALNREASNMLLGLINPTQFVQELRSVGIEEASIGPIVKELNDKVFIPLHEKMLQPEATKESDSYDDVPSEVKRNLETTTPTVFVQPNSIPSTSAPIISTPQSLPVVSVPTPPPAVPPAPTPSFVPPAPSAAASIQAGGHQMPGDVRTMASDMAIMQSGGTPLYTAPAAAPVYAPPIQPVTPAPSPAPQAVRAPAAFVPPTTAPQPVIPPAYVPPASISVPVPPPAVRPVAPHVQQATSRVPAPAPSVPRPIQAAPTSNENREALHQVLKSYGVDPYREPPE